MNPRCVYWLEKLHKNNAVNMSWLNTIDKNNPYHHGFLDYNKPWVPKDYKK
jgi:hypothetical protein